MAAEKLKPGGIAKHWPRQCSVVPAGNSNHSCSRVSWLTFIKILVYPSHVYQNLGCPPGGARAIACFL